MDTKLTTFHSCGLWCCGIIEHPRTPNEVKSVTKEPGFIQRLREIPLEQHAQHIGSYLEDFLTHYLNEQIPGVSWGLHGPPVWPEVEELQVEQYALFGDSCTARVRFRVLGPHSEGRGEVF